MRFPARSPAPSLLVTAAALAVLLLASRPAAAGEAEQVDNPEYALWKGFHVGAWARLRTEAKTGDQGSTVVITTKLVELTAEKAVLESTTTVKVAGQEFAQPAMRRDVPARIAKVETPPVPEVEGEQPKTETKEGTEDVAVAGRTLACKTVEVRTEGKDLKMWSKSWSSDAVPGHQVKSEVKMELPTASTVATVLEDFATP